MVPDPHHGRIHERAKMVGSITVTKSLPHSQFLTPLWLENVDGDIFIVCAIFKYYSELLRGVVIVPIRTETDFASIPKLVRGLVPKSGKYNPAAVLHDAGYNGKLVTESGQRINLIKPLCDALFDEAMGVSGVNPILRHIMFAMVSRFGKKAA